MWVQVFFHLLFHLVFTGGDVAGAAGYQGHSQCNNGEGEEDTCLTAVYGTTNRASIL